MNFENNQYVATKLQGGRKHVWSFYFKGDVLPTDEEIEEICLKHDYLFEYKIQKNQDTQTVLYSGWTD